MPKSLDLLTLEGTALMSLGFIELLVLQAFALELVVCVVGRGTWEF